MEKGPRPGRKTKINKMDALIGLAAFVAAALVGWAVAELKMKACNYHPNEEEVESEKRSAAQITRELSIKDVISSISTKGFKAN